jgi:AcrR family transcriptional regulator
VKQTFPVARTQAERRATTRAALLDATVVCLAERGYTGTTTTEIVRRAGVSRGAQVHHFPTKEALVIAAIDHLLELRLEEYAKAFAELPDDRRDVGTALDLLWTMFTGPTFAAWLELVVGARTDPALKGELRTVTARFDERVGQMFAELYPEQVPDPATAVPIMQFVFAVLSGLALQHLIDLDSAPAVLDLLKSMAAVVLPSA